MGLSSVFSSEVTKSDTFANQTCSWDENAEPFKRTWCTRKPRECLRRCGRSCISTFKYCHWFESMASLPPRFSHPVPFLCLGISPKVGKLHQHSTCEEEARSQAVLTCIVLNLAMNSPNSNMSGHETIIRARRRRVVTCGQKKNYPLHFPQVCRVRDYHLRGGMLVRPSSRSGGTWLEKRL